MIKLKLSNKNLKKRREVTLPPQKFGLQVILLDVGIFEDVTTQRMDFEASDFFTNWLEDDRVCDGDPRCFFLEDLLRGLGAAASRMLEYDDGWIGAAPSALVAHDSPEEVLAGFSCAGCQHRDGGLIGEQPVAFP